MPIPWRSASARAGMAETPSEPFRLVSVALDADSIGFGTPDQKHERLTAIDDLLEANSFAVPGHGGGPYGLVLSIREARLVLDIRTEAGEPVIVHLLSLRPFRRLLEDYMFVCDSYVAAIRSASPAQIEAIDMGRRGLHDEGAERLTERLQGKIDADFATMRRLFTLLFALHWRG